MAEVYASNAASCYPLILQSTHRIVMKLEILLRSGPLGLPSGFPAGNDRRSEAIRLHSPDTAPGPRRLAQELPA